MDSIAARTFSLGEIVGIGLVCWLYPLQAQRDRRDAARCNYTAQSIPANGISLAVQYHYDVGNDFYSLWLDRNLQYSCGYFPTGAEDLDTAQERKMEHICRKLRLQRGERLLDIGCGWGGLARYAASKYGVDVLGVTLSKNQKAYADEQIARAGLRERVAVELKDYRDLGNESFDKVVSVGMFEHVGRSHLPEYFAQVYRLLKPGGLFLNHGISRRAQLKQTNRALFKSTYLWARHIPAKVYFPGW